MRTLTLALASLLVAVALPTKPPPPPPPPYLADQARKGQIVYYLNCAECHGASLEGHFGPALAGGDGNVQWDTVSYVWSYVTEHMPAGNAGGLTQEQYVDVMAFLLKMHGHPAGRSALKPKDALESKAVLGP